jgi:hypothetical protein
VRGITVLHLLYCGGQEWRSPALSSGNEATLREIMQVGAGRASQLETCWTLVRGSDA